MVLLQSAAKPSQAFSATATRPATWIPVAWDTRNVDVDQTLASWVAPNQKVKRSHTSRPQGPFYDVPLTCRQRCKKEIGTLFCARRGWESAFKHESGISGCLTSEQSDRPVVLVADDEIAIRNIARFTLEEAGYFVLTAGDGEQALNLSRGFHGTIHVLVSDMVMPKLDGMALREQILRERPTVKVLLMSGSVDGSLEGVAFLPKPFAGENSTSASRNWLNQPCWG